MSANSFKKIVAGTFVVLLGLGLTACGSDDPNQMPELTAQELAIKELESRGFANVVHERTTDENTIRLYGDLGDCRVRLQKDREGIYALILDDYRVVDPTMPLLEEDPALTACFANIPMAPSSGSDDTAPTAHPDDK